MNITVVVCTYNRSQMLREALGALTRQSVPAGIPWDVIVVDNNSPDATRPTVEEIRETAPMPITYLFERRQGRSYAMNAAIARLQSAVIAFTDDDVLPAPDWVAMIARSIGEWNADVVGGRMLPRWKAPVPGWLATSVALRSRLGLMEHEEAVRLSSSMIRPCIWGGNMACRREVFLRIGTFDPRLGRVGDKLYGGEEVDLIRRALAAGCTVMYDPRLVVFHQLGPERLRRSYFRQHYFDAAEGEVLREGATTGRSLLGVPLYRYRYALAALVDWLVALSLLRRDRFDRELEFIAALGKLRGHWLSYRSRHTLPGTRRNGEV